MDELSREAILEIFRKTGALLQGHFLLTSGLHSGTYFQCARVFQYPEHAERLCQNLASTVSEKPVDVVVSPAIGGILVGYEAARHLGARALFTERVDGKMCLRRGFEIMPGERILVVEDVTTTGGSVREVMEVVRSFGAEVVAVAAVVDRSGGRIAFGVPYHALLTLEVTTYAPEACPLCDEGIPAIKPGSRGLA